MRGDNENAKILVIGTSRPLASRDRNNNIHKSTGTDERHLKTRTMSGPDSELELLKQRLRESLRHSDSGRGKCFERIHGIIE